MTFPQMSARWFEPASQWIMIFGIVALCQPWSEVLHRYGLTITLAGLVGFLVFSHIRPDPAQEGDVTHG